MSGRAEVFRVSDGTELHVVSQGPADAEVTVVLLHGWTLTSDTWRWVAGELASRDGAGARVLRYDIRGHGRSTPTGAEGATLDRIADDAAELIAALAPEGPLVLAGHSMGGMTIMALADRHPELFTRVAGVALVNTSSGGLRGITLGLPGVLGRAVLAVERRVTRRIGRSRRPVLAPRSKPLRPALRWLLFGDRVERGDLVDAARQVACCHPVALAGFRVALDEHERWHALKVLRGRPVVVLAGGMDRLTPPSHSRVIADALPGAELVVYGGAGHMLPFERAIEVTERIAGLVRHAAASAPASTGVVEDEQKSAG
ncbi:Pimeloyl-ACP methyl ester carboxylesterase [Streptoalloteichus tenebrarius]|uniref:Pimeloyl-ACP methyl ester carboxylesterase n=1 Tax=Streptoalloteichus tenebrarius (strain ATCC 17920 / DSM 40477 / JCM 4838 / CBS 697.72 / NBRC 16177 / NCIMB 11028 / NRRL B-12390 / A12253. 1 / ISP 5477) TaxID=1933 RepID=A0ABT1HVQ2_STRSD|nr:alpha/beta hydrolase [Streptoalloteichus tenebrarius]MCP2259605.1 Pimeloyl-ACP methyl ester carboxylesterase [Streptoalloteichus tenebrarius]